MTTLEANSLGTTAKAASVDPQKLTPAMRQYVEQKKRVGEAVLLFRMGDFYETFYEDAVLCSKVLGITLTSRSKDHPVPLAGIPYHALDGYLSKLVAAGYKVAISEQMEEASQAKGVVKRDVVRVVTAGTLTDDNLLSDRDDNLLAAISVTKKNVGLAMVELASGRFEVVDLDHTTLLDELVRAHPAELLMVDGRGEVKTIADDLYRHCGTAITTRPDFEFADYQAQQCLHEHFDVATLAGFGFDDMTPGLCAAGALMQYLQETQKTSLVHIHKITRRVSGDHLQIDHSTWRSLEVDRTLRSGAREGTLLYAIDQTVHPMGARKLRHWLRRPLIDQAQIMHRQDGIGFFVEQSTARQQVRKRLKILADVERIASRIALVRANPRDLLGLANALTALPSLQDAITESRVAILEDIHKDLDGQDALADRLKRALQEEVPATTNDGGYIADGFDAELDRLRCIRTDGQSWLAEYQKSESARTKISNLKVGYNRVFGYYLEVTHSARDLVPPEYVRKQTIKNAERYITEALKKHETEVLTAAERAVELERTLFEQLRCEVADRLTDLMRVANAIGELDCLSGLAELAATRRYTRPSLTTDCVLDIRDGRHPVLDHTLGTSFVPNDCSMAAPDSMVFVITGPNMAGKSTYIRQVALITLLAQIGSFVPASTMTFMPTDRIFARVGASDEIMRGQSTFMVEMSEAATILHHATDRSLVVLDELGRGTSTFDGLSLAWAITEHLSRDIRCRTLVATHYHEMTELADILKGVRNYNVAVREYSDGATQSEGIAFLHRIVPGGASKSYGVHVAKLAGIPKPVIARSLEVLDELQRGFEREAKSPQLSRRKTKDDGQLTLFRDHGEQLLELLRSIDPQQLTPMQALQLLQTWKDQLST